MAHRRDRELSCLLALIQVGLLVASEEGLLMCCQIQSWRNDSQQRNLECLPGGSGTRLVYKDKWDLAHGDKARQPPRPRGQPVQRHRSREVLGMFFLRSHWITQELAFLIHSFLGPNPTIAKEGPRKTHKRAFDVIGSHRLQWQCF